MLNEVDSSVIDPSLRETLLKLAQSGDTDQLERILKNDLKPLNEIKDWTGDSLLAIACWQNKYETAKLLVELGADVNSTNNNGSTPLHRACYRNNIELVILLTNNGADYAIKDKSGRKPADVGDRIVKKVIYELQRVSEEEKERETLQQQEMEQERDAALAQVREEERMELLQKRQQKAVPILVKGAKMHRLNGCYEPVDEIISDWPVYSLRGDRDTCMCYLGSEWLIQPVKDKGTTKAYVRLKCEEPTYPELRLEGNNGIIESTFSMVFGVPFQFSSQISEILVLTEEEDAGNRASEMFKLDSMSRSLSDPASEGEGQQMVSRDRRASESDAAIAGSVTATKRRSFSSMISSMKSLTTPQPQSPQSPQTSGETTDGTSPDGVASRRQDDSKMLAASADDDDEGGGLVRHHEI